MRRVSRRSGLGTGSSSPRTAPSKPLPALSVLLALALAVVLAAAALLQSGERCPGVAGLRGLAVVAATAAGIVGDLSLVGLVLPRARRVAPGVGQHARGPRGCG